MHRPPSINGSFEGPFSDYAETSKCSVDITVGLTMRNFDWCDGAQMGKLGQFQSVRIYCRHNRDPRLAWGNSFTRFSCSGR